MLAPTMRPEFRTDVYYVSVPEGVYLRGNASRLILKGKSLYPLLEHLLPYLNGHMTLDELTRGLDASKKRMITHLLEKLFAHQFLRDASQDQPSPLVADEAEKYAANRAFSDFFQASAVSGFERFCQQRFVLLGCTSGLSVLVQACRDSGVKQISVLATPEEDGGSGFSQEKLELTAGNEKSEQTARLIPASCWDSESELRTIIRDCDAVVHLAARPMLARAQRLNRLCVEERKAFIQALPVGDQVWIGPLVCAKAEGCWECAWRRLQANLTSFSAQPADYALRDQPRAPGSRFLAPSELAMLAQQLIFSLFKHFTQAGSSETERHLSVLHLATGLSETHAFLPHPHCQVCQPLVVPTAEHFLEQIQHLQHQSPGDQQTFMERLTGGVVDARFGLFSALEEADVTQMPLAIYKTTLSNPMLRPGCAESFSLAEAGIEIEDTRLRTAQKACTSYAASLVDCRRLLSSEVAQQLSAPMLPADQVFGEQAYLDQQKLWAWALDVQTQQAWLVPAGQVFPSLLQQARRAAGERGIASGMSWDEALCQALLDWCNYLTVAQLKNAQQPHFRVDLTGSLLTSEGAYLHRLLKTATDEEIVVYDITGPLRVPTFATCCGEKIVAYSTHWDQAQALSMGFVRVLQQHQAEPSFQFEDVLAPMPDFPAGLRGSQSYVPHYTLPETWPDRLAWVLKNLQVSGFHALAVPLDHDPALVPVLPFIVRVLLYNAQSKRGE